MSGSSRARTGSSFIVNHYYHDWFIIIIIIISHCFYARAAKAPHQGRGLGNRFSPQRIIIIINHYYNYKSLLLGMRGPSGAFSRPNEYRYGAARGRTCPPPVQKAVRAREGASSSPPATRPEAESVKIYAAFCVRLTTRLSDAVVPAWSMTRLSRPIRRPAPGRSVDAANKHARPISTRPTALRDQ